MRCPCGHGVHNNPDKKNPCLVHIKTARTYNNMPRYKHTKSSILAHISSRNIQVLSIYFCRILILITASEVQAAVTAVEDSCGKLDKMSYDNTGKDFHNKQRQYQHIGKLSEFCDLT